MKVILLDKEINYILAKFRVTQNLYIVYKQVVLTKYQFMKNDWIKREQLDLETRWSFLRILLISENVTSCYLLKECLLWDFNTCSI